mgnify:CR=1 FL=1
MLPYFDIYKILCDAFTVPGVVLILVGVLIIISKDGLFDGLTYTLSHLFQALIPGRIGDKNEKYYDYVMRKRGQRETPIWKYLVIPGAVFLFISIVFLVFTIISAIKTWLSNIKVRKAAKKEEKKWK